MAEDDLSVYNGAELTEEGARYWLAMDGWDKDEAALLLHAIDPMKLQRWGRSNGGPLTVSFPVQFDALKAMIVRAFDAGVLHSPSKPADVIAWAKLKQLKLPAQFLEAAESVEKPVSTRERNTLLIIIAVLCKEAKLDYTKPAKTAGLIQGAAAGMGVSIGESTIEGHLKKIPDALGSRTR